MAIFHACAGLMFMAQGIIYEAESALKSVNGIIYMILITIIKLYFGLLIILNLHFDKFFIVWVTIPMALVLMLTILTLISSS